MDICEHQCICGTYICICEHQCICEAYICNGVRAALDHCEIYSPVKPDDFSEFWLLVK